MKQNLSPAVIIGVIVAAVIVVGLVGFWVWRAPSVTPAAGVSQSGPPGPREGGGPTAEDLKKRDEYYRTHPEAAGSRPGMR